MKLDIEEALRYLGAGTDAPEDLRRTVTEVGEELVKSVQPRWTWQVIPLGET